MKKEYIWYDEAIKEVKKSDLYKLKKLNKEVMRIYKNNIENNMKNNTINKTKELDITYIKSNLNRGFQSECN